MLCNSWAELDRRYRKQANDYNHAAAWLMGTKMAAPKEPIEHRPWLPYQLDTSRYLPAHIQQIIERLHEHLPQQMLMDLYNKKLIPLP